MSHLPPLPLSVPRRLLRRPCLVGSLLGDLITAALCRSAGVPKDLHAGGPGIWRVLRSCALHTELRNHFPRENHGLQVRSLLTCRHYLVDYGGADLLNVFEEVGRGDEVDEDAVVGGETGSWWRDQASDKTRDQTRVEGLVGDAEFGQHGPEQGDRTEVSPWAKQCKSRRCFIPMGILG